MKKLVIVTSTWCANCGPLKKKLEDAGIEFETVDADENMEFCRNYGVRGLPHRPFL